ncbi:MAG: hypothetical protein IPH98_06665 [Saprospiraceae bacterium]|nr:hypothetical protein [Candidatus Defluviibacterium haderslevense]
MSNGKFVGLLSLAGNVLRLGEGGDFTTNFHTKHAVQIYEKLSYEARNRHFCQGAVTCWRSVHRVDASLVYVAFAVCCRVAFVSVVHIVFFIFQKGRKFFNSILFGLEKSTLICKLWFEG